MSTDEKEAMPRTWAARGAAGAQTNGRSRTWDSTQSDATRHLCAAAHLERGIRARPGRPFRRSILDAVGRHPYRAIGASPGVDLAEVIAHCRAANRRKALRDAVLTLLALLAVSAVVLADSSAERVLVALCVAVVAWEVVYAEMAVSAYRIVAPRLLRGSVAADVDDDPRLDDVRAAASGNVTVYSGFSPFVGSGAELGGWSFALDADRGRRELGRVLPPRAFTLEGLYAHVTHALERLSVPGIAIDDQVHVDGKEIREDRRFLDGPLERPRVTADVDLLASILNGSDEHVRHYKRIRVIAWRGELVLSVFLRFTLVRSTLFAEVNYFLLPPLQEHYRQADRIERSPTWLHKARLARAALLATPWTWLTAPGAATDFVRGPWNEWRARRRWRREVVHNPAFDYGAAPTPRETTSSRNFRQFFQKLDSEMYQKVIERQILDAIITFLDEHDIDTSDLKERETAILNNGVIVTGGSVRADSLAVGQRARASTAKGGAA